MSFNLYNNIQIEIDMLDTRIKDMENEREYLRKMMYANAPKFKGVVDYSKESVTGGVMPLPLDIILTRIQKIDDSIDVLEKLLNEKKRSRDRLDMMLRSLDGLDKKVTYMRDIKGMRLQEIADELGYGIDRIKQISSRNPKKRA